MFKIDDVKRIQLAKSLMSLGFWVPIAFLYYKSQGFSDEQVYSVIGFLQLFMVLLEYPTGVIGDVFGHKISVALGYFTIAFSFIIIGSGVAITYFWMHVLLFLFATGSAFASGSDVALLHSVSNDFKGDMANMAKLAGVFTSVGMIVGGFISPFSLSLPFFLSGLGALVAGMLVMTVKAKKEVKSEEAGVFDTAILGMKESFLNMDIFFPIFISAIFGMYLISEKWVLPTVFGGSGIPLAFFGIATALVMFFRGQASGMYKRFGEQPYWLLIILTLISSLLISFNYVSIVGLILVYGFAAYLNTQADITINEKVDSRARASVVSFRNLLVRLLNSPYLWIISFASARLEFSGVNVVMSLTLVVFILIISVVYIFRTRTNYQSAP